LSPDKAKWRETKLDMDPKDLETKTQSIGYDADENGQSRQV
jgi:hypothetical protein